MSTSPIDITTPAPVTNSQRSPEEEAKRWRDWAERLCGGEPIEAHNVLQLAADRALEDLRILEERSASQLDGGEYQLLSGIILRLACALELHHEVQL